MKKINIERIAVAMTLLGLSAIIVLPFSYESGLRRVEASAPVEVVTLTGNAETGTWTDREVRSVNYWTRDFPAARPVLHVGQKTRFRFKSADVVHKFYSPALGIGPVEVYPGHVVEIDFTPEKSGVFQYYCTMVCGEPHFGMRGEIVVVGNEKDLSVGEAPERGDEFWKVVPPAPDASVVERGKWLFHKVGCFTCHGAEGKGGVPNWNYIKDTVPALNTMADKLKLFYPEDATIIVDALESGVPLDSLSEDPPVPRFNLVLAQYHSVKDVIRKGNPPGKKDPKGPEPPLQMLPWSHRLSDRDVDSIIAYLLTLQPWEDIEE